LSISAFSVPIEMTKKFGNAEITDPLEQAAIIGQENQKKLVFMKTEGSMPLPDKEFETLIIDRFGRKKIGYKIYQAGEDDFKPMKGKTKIIEGQEKDIAGFIAEKVCKFERVYEPVDQDVESFRIQKAKQKIEKYKHPNPWIRNAFPIAVAIGFLIVSIGLVIYFSGGVVPLMEVAGENAAKLSNAEIVVRCIQTESAGPSPTG